jgi:predicted metal-dependent HD superfamily phosphohydrolase
MNYKELLERIREYVLEYYQTRDTSKLNYHNRQHIEDVVTSAGKIANHYQLGDHDFFIVMASVWLHDIGYLTQLSNHEAEGSMLAAAFLSKQTLDTEDILLIQGCIMATKLPQSAKTLAEQIVCDADLFHLGTKEFFKNDKLLLAEYDALHETVTDKLEWRKRTLVFLDSHSWYTEYCKVLLNDVQLENIKELQKKIKKAEKKELEIQSGIVLEPTITKISSPIKKEKKDKTKPEKGIETMFRISSSNHQRLSDMADKKAHIMITVNSIILSAIISLVLRRLDAYGYLIGPSFILLSVSLTAMTFSILSTRPSIPKGTFTPQQMEEKKVNLLFFGNFYKMQFHDFNDGMIKMMQDSDFLYGSLIRDLYAQGVVLGKKYQFLRIAYNIFMFGLIVAVLAFTFAFIFMNHPSVAVPAVPKAK